MKVRRVVTGHTPEGKSTVASDSEIEGITPAIWPGYEFHRLSEADEAPCFPDAGTARNMPTYYPPVGGFRVGLLAIPPDSLVWPEDLDHPAARREVKGKPPGTYAVMEPDHPGFHTTDTVDFEYVISGEIWLELDGGVDVHLRAGDTVVQNGTRHAWRNRSSEPCRMVLCMVGADRC